MPLRGGLASPGWLPWASPPPEPPPPPSPPRGQSLPCPPELSTILHCLPTPLRPPSPRWPSSLQGSPGSRGSRHQVPPAAAPLGPESLPEPWRGQASGPAALWLLQLLRMEPGAAHGAWHGGLTTMCRRIWPREGQWMPTWELVDSQGHRSSTSGGRESFPATTTSAAPAGREVGFPCWRALALCPCGGSFRLQVDRRMAACQPEGFSP